MIVENKPEIANSKPYNKTGWGDSGQNPGAENLGSKSNIVVKILLNKHYCRLLFPQLRICFTISIGMTFLGVFRCVSSRMHVPRPERRAGLLHEDDGMDTDDGIYGMEIPGV